MTTVGVMFPPGMSSSGTFMLTKLMKNYLGMARYLHELNTENLLSGLCIPISQESGKRRIEIMQSCS